MELILVVVGAIVVTAIAQRRGLEPALIIVVVGIAVSFVPGFEAPELDSHILLSVVLPPLLYSAALDFSFPTFLRNIKPILGLGVGLVVVTAFTVAAVSSWLVVVPLTFATALVLGAVVAPPDAVTAVAVGRKLGLPKRVMSILTGESLINDAAALALFSVAVAQVAGSHTFIENPLLLFAYSAVLGPLVGAALGYITLWIRRRLANPALETVQGLMVPFAAFILAEEMHASGVLAVVVAGFVVGSGTVDAGYQTRLQERFVWNSVDVLLEVFVFAYIGLHLRFVLEDLQQAHESLTQVAVASAVVLLIVLVIRPLSVFAMFGRGVLARQVERRLSVPIPEGGGRGALGVRRQSQPPAKWRSRIDNRALSWQENVVVSWTGMRGVVTLAAAAAIPATTAAGAPFPERATIQAIAFVVSVGTLLLQGWTLPLLIRRLKLSADADQAYTSAETQKAEQVVHAAADEVLAEFRANPPDGLDPRVLAEIGGIVARHSQDADEMPDPEAPTLRAEVFGQLYRDVLAAQRVALIGERDAGRIDEEAVRAMLVRLDLQEAGVSARLESRF
ncbi:MULTISPECIES: cation:proton antiporter [Mycolicibacterium]|uniref:Sodium/proton antiporter, CPA1 family n=2 Tax=Mycolicibacterium TaxID=1866885 RepID=A1TCC7_MYCVP|nr:MULTISPECIES: sodium:proton antiporter [Mycolicibacterium]ABM14827.1 sodium/proton antiporter, CPA1 family [Mycolicibacterium vanbaalenii PYR-1]MCV7128274.1 sodium:proton antiporter [Mycolicibacterium vanbaalenii PYR-1]MDN4522022.1 sodium:proton antiporter [Mycolicibacterium austroafricanum]MDW5611245.1 sodium:proton antiporter [Mycolicibacterium sp. D5.8-2]PQP43360.1 sodium:proton antiporter [Mycolicibacterium austroafricanum]